MKYRLGERGLRADVLDKHSDGVFRDETVREIAKAITFLATEIEEES